MGVGVVDGYVRRFKRYGTINETAFTYLFRDFDL